MKDEPCKHGHMTPPECLACVIDERNKALSDLSQREQQLRTEIGKTEDALLTQLKREEEIDTLTAALKTAKEALAKECIWVIWFEDAEVLPEVFTGTGAEAAARKRFESAIVSWSAHLLKSSEPSDQALAVLDKAGVK